MFSSFGPMAFFTSFGDSGSFKAVSINWMSNLGRATGAGTVFSLLLSVSGCAPNPDFAFESLRELPSVFNSLDWEIYLSFSAIAYKIRYSSGTNQIRGDGKRFSTIAVTIHRRLIDYTATNWYANIMYMCMRICVNVCVCLCLWSIHWKRERKS